MCGQVYKRKISYEEMSDHIEFIVRYLIYKSNTPKEK